MKKHTRLLSIVLVLILILTTPAFAHSGRTDSSGGHKDNKNKSGLGSYHYHCGGHPAHLHSGGICPYSPKDTISISNSPSRMYIGDSIQLNWTVTAYSGSEYVTWTSSDESVVKISSLGLITAVGSGNAKITAELRNGQKTFNLSVSKRAVEKITLNLSNNTPYIGSVIKAAINISPENATDKSIGWLSDNEDTAIVTDDGLIIVIGEGTAKITASSLDGSNRTDSVIITSIIDEDHKISSAHILAQLPINYVFSVKPGSAAANFVKLYSLPFEYAVPIDLPLTIGSRGETVKDIQTALTANGYLNDKIDGIFGKNTDTAIATFCTTNNIIYTGMVGFDCYAAILESNYIAQSTTDN